MRHLRTRTRRVDCVIGDGRSGTCIDRSECMRAGKVPVVGSSGDDPERNCWKLPTDVQCCVETLGGVETSPLPYKSRSQWNADDWNWGSCSTYTAMNNPYRITIHHTASSKGSSVLQFQRDHQDPDKDWCDIGYHFLVDYQGIVYQGRPFQDDHEFGGTIKTALPAPNKLKLIQGAHVKGANSNNIGISLIGCFDPTCANQMTLSKGSAQYESLVSIMEYLSKAYNIEPKWGQTVWTHKDFDWSNTCPGQSVIGMLSSVIRDVQANLAK